MTRWVAWFDDDPDVAAVREKYSSDHLAYLDRHRDRILLPGGLREAPGGTLVGGLWVVDVASREEAAALCENDPFFRHGLRKRYHLRVWGKAFPDRTVAL